MIAELRRNPEKAFLALLVLCAAFGLISVVALLSHKGIVVPFGWETKSLQSIRTDGGFAYVAQTQHPELSARKWPSMGLVLEDGAPLSGPANAQPDEIRNLGHGRFSFLGDEVVFSPSDNQPIAATKRSYSISYPVTLNYSKEIALCSLALFFGLAAVFVARTSAAIQAWLRRLPKILFDPLKPRRRSIAAIAVIVTWPFVFLYAYTFDIVSIGNDFDEFYSWKPYLLTMLRHGVFPLWSPTESCGYPFFSCPFAQAFYPLNLVYYLYYWLLGHFSIWDYELLTILALSIFGVGLFLWLRRLRISPGVALAATLCAEMSLKVTELLRFPNAAHAAAWYPWLLLGLTVASERRYRALGSIILGASLLMLLTAGYPYFIVFAGFLLVPFAGAMLGGPLREAFYLDGSPAFCGRGRYLLRIGIPGALALFAAIPLLLNTQALLAQTVDRGSPRLEFAAENSFTLTEAIGGWFFPPVSTTEGWYYFGAVCLVLLGFHCVSSLVGLAGHRRDRPIVGMIVFWALLVLYFTLGKESALFVFVWRHAAVLDQMRCWARMTIILVPPISLLLARSLIALTRELRNPQQRFRPAGLVVFIAVVAVPAVGQFLFLRQGHFDYYWTSYFKGHSFDMAPARDLLAFRLTRSFDEWRFLKMTFGAAALLALFLFGRVGRSLGRFAPFAFLAAFVGFTAAEMGTLSPYQWVSATDVSHSFGYFDAWSLVKAEFSEPRDAFRGGLANVNSPAYSAAPYNNWDFIRHVRVYNRYLDFNGAKWQDGIADSDKQPVVQFYGLDSGARRIFFSSKIDQQTIPLYMGDANRFEHEWHPTFRVKSYDGDNMLLEVTLPHSGWLTFVDNWDPFWTAAINGNATPISRLLGSYKAVPVPAGKSVVRFSYRPAIWPRAIDRLLANSEDSAPIRAASPSP